MQDAVVGVMMQGISEQYILQMDYVSFYSFKGSIDRNRASYAKEQLTLLACVQGDGKSYKKVDKALKKASDPPSNKSGLNAIDNL